MGVYLKKFLTISAYNNANLVLPNVSLIELTNTVEYNPLIPPYSGFCKLYLNDGSEVEIQGSGTLELTSSQRQQYLNTCVGVEIGIQCTAIGDNTFDSFSDKLASVTIPNSVTSIGELAFQQCYGLTSIIIPSSITTIGRYAFSNSYKLTSITIPSGVTSIEVGTFRSCSGLTNIEIPNSVTRIGAKAFQYCGGLTSVTVKATTPPVLSDVNAFDNTNNCPIYVPSASVDAYKATAKWSSLSSRIQAIP